MAPEPWLPSATSQSGHSEWPDAPTSPKPPDGPDAPWTAHSPSSDSHHDLGTAVTTPLAAFAGQVTVSTPSCYSIYSELWGRAGRDVLGESGVVAGGQGGQACLVGRPEQPVVVADDGVEILAEDAGGGEVDRVE